MADVCVIGLGYVGLPTACLLANSGVRVLGVDTNADKVSALNSGRTRAAETGLDTLVLAAFASGNLRVGAAPEPSETFVICVPTPVAPGEGADLSAVESATRSILPVLARGNLVIVESTSPVGTTRNCVGRLLAASGMEPETDFHLAYCPERVLPGKTVAELVNNDRLIGGLTPASAERAKGLYARFSSGRLVLTDDLTAEMCKLMENAFRDVNIALANAFSRIAEETGVDIWQAIGHANLHPRVNILQPGPGVGGHCIPVDPWFLITGFPEDTALLRAAREINDGQPARIIKRLVACGLAPGEKIAVLGAAYKANVDDPRGSPSFALAREAAALGFPVAVHDPFVPPGEHDGVAVADDLAGCLAEAAAAVLVTDHESYRRLGSGDFAPMSGKLIYDTRGFLDHDDLRRAGFVVHTLGIGGKGEAADKADQS